MNKTNRIRSFFTVALVAAGLSFTAARAHAYQYALDDGSAEDSIGLTAGGDIICLNEFTVTGGNTTINSISIAWGTPLFPDSSLNGLAYTAVLWSDPNGDGQPDDAVVLATAAGVISNASTDTFDVTAITPTTLSTGNFFVGFIITQGAGQFPAALDEDSDQMRSYIAASLTPGGGDINNLDDNDLPVDSLDDVGFAGNWLIRADAVPEPSTWASLLMGGGLLVFALRARRVALG